MRRQIRYRLFAAAALMMSTASTQADTVNTEALGVINGSIMQRSQMIEIKPFLSGRPVYQYDVQDNQPPVDTLVIEQAQLVGGSHNSDGIVWIQQPLALSGMGNNGVRGHFQLPLKVEVSGQPITVGVRQDNRGLILNLPQPSRQVRLRPAGAITFLLPVTYRGELRADIRISSNTSAAETLQE
ncbi:DUF5462 family protein [Serratia fonticola]|jgi:hypothetical protein|uniref:DUF5462 family protein n=1 Tax=Serratia fonticola TaxID=47917 RepID=UPI001415387C|nr:DUF5462 family protein [Serratia fonticola]NXZ89050.1 DUF5462 family protein [Serratia fonticola]QIP90031.1 hypothetical protein HAP32_00548 [Serratia fonticola]